MRSDASSSSTDASERPPRLNRDRTVPLDRIQDEQLVEWLTSGDCIFLQRDGKVVGVMLPADYHGFLMSLEKAFLEAEAAKVEGPDVEWQEA